MMTASNSVTRFAVILLVALSMALFGCSSGSSTPASVPSPSLAVQPASFNFGVVTQGNEAAVQPLEVTLFNNGSAELLVSAIELTGSDDFFLDATAGVNACGSTAPTIAANSGCVVRVSYLPNAFGAHTATLSIQSNDANAPTFDLNLQGAYEAIQEDQIKVKINQIIACPRENAKVYVAVTDQGDFAVTGLAASNFTLLETGGTAIPPKTFGYIAENGTNEPLSVALLLDYSGSIFIDGNKYRFDMENAASAFVGNFAGADEAEIIKFGTEVEVMQAFTTKETLLTDAIKRSPDIGFGTALYDAIDLALDGLHSPARNDRKAIIVMTDGMDDDGTGAPQSDATLAQVIAKANAIGVPVFTVGVAAADTAILTEMADETGGAFYPSATSSNLATIYQQISDLLFGDQYILTFDSALLPGAAGSLNVTVTYNTTPKDDTKEIPACP